MLLSWIHYLCATEWYLWSKWNTEVINNNEVVLFTKRNWILQCVNTQSDDWFFFEVDWYEECLYWNYKASYVYYNEDKDLTIRLEYLEDPVYFSWDVYWLKNKYLELWEVWELSY